MIAAHLQQLSNRVKRGVAQKTLERSGRVLNTTVLSLEYPPNAVNVPRYSRAHPQLNELIAAGENGYRQVLATFGQYADDMARIALREGGATRPSWINRFLPGLDGAAIYGFLRSTAPTMYIEVGSGNSTKFAALAKNDGRLQSRIVSIDPSPRASINPLCDEIIRDPLESLRLSVWERVQPGDVIFMDGSHRVFMNNDVVAFFLDVLPNLPAGVLVGIHDIYLPFDYPIEIAGRYYSEQYVLAAYLLGGAQVDIVLPAHYAFVNMRSDVEALWGKSRHFANMEHHGCAFWLRT